MKQPQGVGVSVTDRTGALSTSALRRLFSRQLKLPGFGLPGQRKLGKSSVLVLGLGAVGSVCALYLSRLGIGRLGIVDEGKVGVHNLHRQVFYGRHDVTAAKASVLARSILSSSGGLRVHTYVETVNKRFLNRVAGGYDIVVDALDSLGSKLVVNDFCVAAGKPFVTGGVGGLVGQMLSYVPGAGPCLRCIVIGRTNAPRPMPAQVFAPVSGIVGCVQAAEVVKLLLGIGRPLVGRLLTVDAASFDVHVIPFARRSTCGAHGRISTPTTGSNSDAQLSRN